MVDLQTKELINYFIECKKRAIQVKEDILLSYTFEIPNVKIQNVYSSADKYEGKRFFWSSSDLQLIGIDHLLRLSLKDNDYEYIIQEMNSLKKITITNSSVIGTGPIAFSALSFDPSYENRSIWSDEPVATCVVPKYLFTFKDSKTWVTINLIVNEETEYKDVSYCQNDLNELIFMSEKDKNQLFKHENLEFEEIGAEEWIRNVANVIDIIQKGELEKIVMARSLKLENEEGFSSSTIIQNLLKNNPSDYIFALENEKSCFLGATPERLIKKENNVILSACLAGSAFQENNEIENEQIKSQLLNDSKNLEEHAYVVEMIKNSLLLFTDSLEIPESPSILTTKALFHLYTPVKGFVEPETNLLQIVKQLHPTPALNGTPTELSKQYIKKYENLDRGFYGGPIGWFDFDNNGEFVVAIRSGYITKKRCYLFAGCGIVDKSIPSHEYLETKTKFKPMLKAITS
ncbi:isochorismate synthase [Bacillus cereus]|nr:isochorismate synthase [Bacillus cereus]